jgi:hypothetical protein
MKKLKLVKGTRFTSFLFIAVSLLISAGIIWGANMYYDIDAGKIIVNETQRIVKDGTNYALEIIGMAKFGGDTDYAKFSTTGDLSFFGGADVIEKSDAPLTIQTTGQTLTVRTVTSGTLAATAAGAMELTGGTNSKIDFPNFDVATTGNITVAAGQGLDTNAAGILALGNTTATTVNIGNTAATTIAIGAGGALARTINIGTGTGVDTINIGTGATGADVITLGGGAGTIYSANNLTFSGTTARTITGPSTGGLTVTVASGPLTLSTTTSGALTLNSAGILDIDASGAITIDTSSGNAITINATGAALNLKTTTSGDITLDPASGSIVLGANDQIKTSSGGAASRLSGEQILREVIPIFGFDLPARTASTSYVTVSRTIENYPFSAALSGTTRVHKFIIRYANSSTTNAITWQVWNVTSGSQTSSFTTPATPGTSLDTGTVYITSDVTIPTNTDDWRLDVKVASGDTVQIYQIFLAAYDQVQ